MPYILVIDKMGAIKETNIKEYKEADLYKKANFKSAEGFALQTTWTGLSLSTDSSSSDISVTVYGKTAGKAGQENKYEFPPPIDSVLFFGGCVLVAKSETDDSIIDLRVSSWNKIYEILMGGFEDLDLGEDVEDGDDENEDVDPNLIGKNGYMKDGFVVEDDDVEFEEDREDLIEEEEEDLVEEEEKPKKKPKRKPAEKKGDKDKKKNDKDKKKKSMEKEGSMSDFSVAVTDNYLDCSSELVEEAYV